MGYASLAVLVLPGLAVALAQMFRQFSDLSGEGRHANLWQGIKWPFAVMLGVLSVVLPLAVYGRDWMVDQGWLDGVFAASMPTWWLAGMIAALGILAGITTRYALGHRPGRTVAFSALWSVCATTLVLMPISRGPLADSPMRADAKMVLASAGDAAVYYWADSEDEGKQIVTPDARLVALLGRVVLPLHVEQLDQLTATDPADDATMRPQHRRTFVLIHATQGFPRQVQEFAAVPLQQGGWRLSVLQLNPTDEPAASE